MDFATPQVFSSARDEPDYDPIRGTKLEIKTYEARYNSNGTRVTLSAGTKSREKITAGAESHPESAFLVTRYYDSDRELEYTEMEIRSPYIREALRVVIKEYPGLAFDTGKSFSETNRDAFFITVKSFVTTDYVLTIKMQSNTSYFS